MERSASNSQTETTASIIHISRKALFLFFCVFYKRLWIYWMSIKKICFICISVFHFSHFINKKFAHTFMYEFFFLPPHSRVRAKVSMIAREVGIRKCFNSNWDYVWWSIAFAGERSLHETLAMVTTTLCMAYMMNKHIVRAKYQRISFDISQPHTWASPSQYNMLPNGPGRLQFASSTPAYTLFLNSLLIWLAGRLVYQFR